MRRIRKLREITGSGITVVFCAAMLAAPEVRGQSAEEFQQLKAMVEQMRKTIDAQNARIADLEKKAGEPAPVPAAVTTPPATNLLQTIHATMAGTNQFGAKSPSIQFMERILAGEQVAPKSPVTYRHTLNDPQEAASRPKDYTLDPEFHGFIPIPNTPALIKFNAKPHLDMTMDNKEAGNHNRFVPAVFPLKDTPEYGGGEQFHVNANGTQLRVDVRAPELGGNFRFYYQNDFFGSGSDTGDMKYRIQHLYGEFYGFKAGFTYSVFEDPDSWPDTVDYEGPNSTIFARRPVAQYTYAWNKNWNSTIGVEKPDFFVDLNSGPAPGNQSISRIPDLGFNTRYEKEGLGHAQFSALFRDLGAKDGLGHTHEVFGWGLNLSLNLDLGECDTVQLLGVYGHGVGGLGNDAGFFNSDAAFRANGDLQALPYWSGMLGYTHKWSDQFRSTFTYGYAHLDNTGGQVGTFYHFTHYASGNIVWQMRKRLSVGLEGLYGFKEVNDGSNSGNHYRVQLGMVYSLFD